MEIKSKTIVNLELSFDDAYAIQNYLEKLNRFYHSKIREYEHLIITDKQTLFWRKRIKEAKQDKKEVLRLKELVRTKMLKGGQE